MIYEIVCELSMKFQILNKYILVKIGADINQQKNGDEVFINHWWKRIIIEFIYGKMIWFNRSEIGWQSNKKKCREKHVLQKLLSNKSSGVNSN